MFSLIFSFPLFKKYTYTFSSCCAPGTALDTKESAVSQTRRGLGLQGIPIVVRRKAYKELITIQGDTCYNSRVFKVL